MARTLPEKLVATYRFETSLQLNSSLVSNTNTYSLAFRGPATVDITGVLDGSKLSFSGALTTAGNYSYTIYFTDADSVKTLLEKGMIEVERDPTSISVDEDLRTHPERVLAAIEAVIEQRASKDQESYTINGRSLNRTPIADLLKLRDKYKDEVKNQYKKLPRAVLYHFGSR